MARMNHSWVISALVAKLIKVRKTVNHLAQQLVGYTGGNSIVVLDGL